MMRRFLVPIFSAFLAACANGNSVGLDYDSGGIPHNDASTDAARPRVYDDSGDVYGEYDVQAPGEGPILYGGGPVMVGPEVRVYYLWYGSWANNTASDILENLAQNISDTKWYGIVKQYFQTEYLDAGRQTTYVSSKITFVSSTYIPSYLGNELSDDQVHQVITDAILAGKILEDPSGVYFVFGSSDIAQTRLGTSFCTDYCGYHEHFATDQTDVKYAYIGNPERCLDSCTDQGQYLSHGLTDSPNKNWGADGMASVVAHELSEMVTDPDINAWVGLSGENADMCSWTFGQVYPTAAGSTANIRVGARDYLIQQNWILGGAGPGNGHCGMAL
jgi:Phosphate-induced protein 1 conserved region